jgi:uncharacterized protein (DUF58 family)
MREGAWLAASIAMLIISLLLRNGLLFTLSAALLMAAGLARIWNRFWDYGLEYRRIIEPRRAFVGEEIEMVIEIVNRKPLPLPWLEIIDELPDDLELVGISPSPSVRPRRVELINLLSLRWYERVRRHYRLRCKTRGYYTLGPVVFRSGDVFGLNMNEIERPSSDPILVYPKIVPISTLGLPAVHPFGDLRARQTMFEDPMRTIGVRPYAPGDSPRRIHWKATARTRELQSRMYEATTTLRLLVFFNVNTLGAQWWWQGHDPEALELGVSIAASVATWGIDHNFQVGLYANGGLRYGEQKLKIPPGRSPAQIVRILEALARLMPIASNSLEDFLRAESGNMPWGSTIVLVTVFVSEETLRILAGLQAVGHRVVVLQIGEDRPTYVATAWPSEPTSSTSGAVGAGLGGPQSLWQRPERSLPAAAPALVAAPLSVTRANSPGIPIHRVKISWSELSDLQLD